MNINSLSDFAILSDSTRSHIRVSLNKRPGTAAEGDFSDRLDVGDLGYACRNKRKRAHFKTGTVNLVFVKVDSNRYLFVAALRITGVPKVEKDRAGTRTVRKDSDCPDSVVGSS